MKKQQILFSYVAAIVTLLLMVTFYASRKHERQPVVQLPTVDLPQIIEKGELVVLTINSSTSYFNYRGEPMGFQYELAQMFCHSIGVELVVKTVNREEELIRQLLAGEGDLIAYNLPVTKDRRESLTFCGEEYITHQVLIQRKGKDVIKDVTQLIDKDVYVVPGKYHTRLANLDEELGGGIKIHEICTDTIAVEDLITWVAEGKIDYTIASNDLAKINRTYNRNLNIDMEISFDQRSSWAVRPESSLLAEAVDKWQEENKDSPAIKLCVQRYFGRDKHTSHGSILSIADGKISYFDDYFRKYSKEIGWDWRMLAALVFTESNFNPEVVSWAGAKGLMQLMPSTAHAFGLPDGMEDDPEESIKAGVKYIASLQRLFRKIDDANERNKFVLASYNAGAGHVIDAMALTEKYGGNKYQWENQVERYILLKSHEQYYQDPVCKNGYFRGQETYSFVRKVLTRTKVYQEKIKK